MLGFVFLQIEIAIGIEIDFRIATGDRFLTALPHSRLSIATISSFSCPKAIIFGPDSDPDFDFDFPSQQKISV
jgi:hypothetical protein